MKYIRTFESFVTDDNRGEDTQYPQHNAALKSEVTEYVDTILRSNEYHNLVELVGMKLPKNVSGEEIDEFFDEVREKAIEHFIENPEQIKKLGFTINNYQVPGNDGVPRTNKVGGTMPVSESIDSEWESLYNWLDVFSKDNRDSKAFLHKNNIINGSWLKRQLENGAVTIEELDSLAQNPSGQVFSDLPLFKRIFSNRMDKDMSIKESVKPVRNNKNCKMVEVSDDELAYFEDESPLLDLVRDEKVTLYDNQIWYNKNDKETIDVLDVYFEL